MDEGETNPLVAQAKLAEQAERYEDMAKVCVNQRHFLLCALRLLRKVVEALLTCAMLAVCI